MKFDIFFSICQTEVDGWMPSERKMWENFFSQVELADQLGFGTAWVAETHLSCEIQKQTPEAVIPHFKGEIGLNTDILQVAHHIFSRTKRMNVGSAIKNILCNGGPLAHAEAIKTFLSLHALRSEEQRHLNIGFASGRFEFSNRPYGIRPRNKTEQVAWKVIKGKVLLPATEIFMRALKSETFGSEEVAKVTLSESDFRNQDDWIRTCEVHAEEKGLTKAQMVAITSIEIPHFWNFEKLGVIPFEAPLEFLRLTIGTHDPAIQALANQFLPVDVFNLSITPVDVIEATHERMKRVYHPKGGAWQRSNMPRTALVYVDDTKGLSEEEKCQRARAAAHKAWLNYWAAMEGTIDEKKVSEAVDNTLAGSPKVLAQLINKKYHPQDRLMLWFDFNNHDNESIKRSMVTFMEKVAPACNS